MPHNNLFEHGANRREVYEQHAGGLRHAVRVRDFLSVVVTFALVLAAVSGPTGGWVWLVVGIGAIAIRLHYSLDASNQNYMLHMMEWDLANDD